VVVQKEKSKRKSKAKSLLAPTPPWHDESDKEKKCLKHEMKELKKGRKKTRQKRRNPRGLICFV
jgi:hypothetical protein